MSHTFVDAILDRVTGRAAGLTDISVERLDWDGLGSLLDLFDSTSGAARAAMIRDLGCVLEMTNQPPQVLADVLHLVSSLDLTQVEPSVQKLAASPKAGDEPVRSALATYWAQRSLAGSNSSKADLPLLDQVTG